MKGKAGVHLSISPNQLILRRFRSNRIAMISLFAIALQILAAVFAYALIPDDSHMSSRQLSACKLYPPGSACFLYQLPNANNLSQSITDFLIYGNRNQTTALPFDSLYASGDSVILISTNPITQESTQTGSFANVSVEAIQAESFRQRFWLGTDRFGRDVFSRLILGTRISLSVGLISVSVSLLIGLFMGAIAGFYGGWVDQLVIWIINVFWSIPTFLLAMGLGMLVSVGTDKTLLIFVAIGLTMWVEIARVVRGQILSIREREFVQATNALGYSDRRTIMKHILPNALAPIIVLAAANFANAILIESGLSFIGLGVPITTPSWGAMLSEYKDLIDSPMAYLAIFPGLAIMGTVLAFNMLGNGLRDALDIRSN